jgi:hypothetical protein
MAGWEQGSCIPFACALQGIQSTTALHIQDTIFFECFAEVQDTANNKYLSGPAPPDRPSGENNE